MKKLWILLILIFGNYTSNSQNLVISNTNNILYLKVVNPLNIVVENMRSGEFIISTDNGLITNIDSFRYVITPYRVGIATIFIDSLNGKDTITIGKRNFIVKNLPMPIATVGGKKGDTISKKILIDQTEIIAFHENFHISGFRCAIKKYSVFIVYSNGDTYYENFKGSVFPSSLKNRFNGLKEKDKVYFIEIIADCPDVQNQELAIIKFVIK